MNSEINDLYRYLCTIDPEQFALLHCISEYPTPLERSNLNKIIEFKSSYGCTIGYSDHTIGIESPLTARILGASIIEKHFTLDKKLFSNFRDHKISADPNEDVTSCKFYTKCGKMFNDKMAG